MKLTEPSNIVGAFKTVVFGRCENESHVIKDFYFWEIQEDIHDFICQQRNNESNLKVTPVTPKKENHSLPTPSGKVWLTV